jgi:translation initiation factor 2 beta subunit (eIF-2beta)/eIF-5
MIVCDVCGATEQLLIHEHDRLLIVTCERCDRDNQLPTKARRIRRSTNNTKEQQCQQQ